MLEAREGLAPEQTVVLPIVTETGRAMLGFGSYAETRVARLFGMLWGGEDLSADLGAKSNRDETGRGYAPPYQLARSCCLYAAAATGSNSNLISFQPARRTAASSRAVAR